ncbi:MAG TPA: FAD-dependent oxidoreductase [Elusimicrobiota bacterium]|nr:FAD-dependent oxidoreductase [Elusimicrobiota bacterium]
MAFDAIVVGGGIIGSAAAYALSKREMRVLLVDQEEAPHTKAPSAEHARLFRLTYGKDSFYTQMALKTIPLWRDFEQVCGETLLPQAGMLDLALGDGRYEEQSLAALLEAGVKAKKLKPLEVCAEYRMFRSRAFRFAVFHPEGGMVLAQKAIAAFALHTRKRKGTLASGVRIVKILKGKNGIQGLKDAQGKTWVADKYVFAAGPWTRELLLAYGLPLSLTRQESLYFRPPQNQGRYRPAHFPVFAASAKGFYGFPVHIHGFMRLGSLKPGPSLKAIKSPAVPDKGYERKARTFLKDLIPDLGDFVDLEGHVGHYTRTPDGDPIIDKLPGEENAWVASGFAGHGPTFAPLVGDIVSKLVLGEKPELNLHRFRIDRLRLKRR